MLLERAERAGAAIEKTRVLGIERRERGWRLRTQQRHRRGRLSASSPPARAIRCAKSARSGAPSDTMSALGYYVPASQRSHRHSVSAAARRLHLGVSALRASFGGHLRERRAGAGAAGAAGSLHGRARHRAQGRDVLQPHAAVARIAGLEEESRGGRRLDGGGRCGRAGRSDHRRRFVLRHALGRSGEPRGARTTRTDSRKRPRPTARCWRASSRVDLEFAATLAKRVFLGTLHVQFACPRGWSSSCGAARGSAI